MAKKYEWIQDARNSISIYRDGKEFCQIFAEEDTITTEHLARAKKIIKALIYMEKNFPD